MLHTTAQECYAKLKRVLHRLMNNFNRDDLDDFISTANSLREWIRQDSAMSDEQKAALQRLAFLQQNLLRKKNRDRNCQPAIFRPRDL